MGPTADSVDFLRDTFLWQETMAGKDDLSVNSKLLREASNVRIIKLIPADILDFMKKAESCVFFKDPGDLTRKQPLGIRESLCRFVVSLLM